MINGFKGCIRGSNRIFLQTISCVSQEAGGGRVSAAVVQQSNKKKDISKSNLNPPKGTRDFYPEDQRLKIWLFDKWRNVAKLYGFEEYDAPIVESEELYIRKAGEEVSQQLYNFEDKSGRRLSLRPEMTPSLARMVLAKGNSSPFPLKWFSIPQCWRYERMTRGRRREHYQWNMDIWGVDSIEAEVELISAAVFFMRDIGLTAKDVGIKINSRKLLNGLMESLGISEDKWVAACVLVDKLEKVPVEALSAELDALGISTTVVEELLSFLKLNDIEEYAKKLGEDHGGVKDLMRLLQLCESYGIKDWVQFDSSVVRGLAYYTGLVYEGFDRSGELRAIFGGGRYDQLLESLGGEPVPAVGFGFGDAVIVEMLKMKNLLPDTRAVGTNILLYAKESKLFNNATDIANELRLKGVSVDLVLDERKTKWVFQRGDKFGINLIVMLTAEDDANSSAVVKSMKNGEQIVVKYDELVEKIKSIL
eukprot:gene5684-7846_t